MLAEVEYQKANRKETATLAASSRSSQYKTSWMRQFGALLWRSILSIKKEPWVTRINFAQTLVRKDVR